MIDLGIVRPGSTIRIPFSSFDKDDGSAITMTDFAAADILVYKDGGTTERASTAGYTATTDFDAKTGKHLAIIDLADNTTAGFWNAGSEYLVAIDAVTIDAVTTGGWIARFRIGYVGAMLDTTIATLSSQTSFTLTAGPAEDDALNGRIVLIHDIASAVQVGQAIVADYTGATKTVTLFAGTTFTVAAGDNISVMDLAPLTPTVIGRTLDVSSGGEAGIDWANIGSPTTAQNLSGTNIDPDQVVASVTGAVGSVTGNVGGNVTGSVGSVTARVTANVDQLGGVAQSLTDLKDFADDGYDPATNKVQGVVLTDTVTTYTGNTPQTGDAFARLGAPAGASVSADIAAIEAQTDDIGAAGAGLTAVPWNAAWDAEVQSEVEDALVVHRLDELLAADSDIDGAAPPTVGSVFHELLSKTAGSFTYDQTTDSLEAIRDKETDIETDTAVIGAAGAGLTAIPWNAAWDAEVESEATDALNAYDPPTGAELVSEINSVQSDIAALNDPTAAAIADAVWDEAIADHQGVGSTGEALSDAGGAGTPPTVGQIADGVWDEILAGHLGVGSTGEALGAAGAAGDPWTTALPGVYGAGSAGNIVGNNLNATVGSRATQASVDTIDDFVDTEVGAIKAKTDQLTFTGAGKVDAAILAAGDFAQGAADKVWASAARTLTSFGTVVADTVSGVWGAATRVLTAGTNIVLAKGTGVTGFNDISQADAQTAATAALTAYDPPTNAELVSEINSVQSDIAALSIPTAAAIAVAVRQSPLSGAVAADGAIPTLEQALFAALQILSEREIAGTTLTIKGLDGVATIMEFTLDDATNPTSQTRSL